VEFFGRSLTSMGLKFEGGHDGNPDLALVAYSRNGLYLASCSGGCGTKTSVTVWEISSRSSVTEKLVGTDVTSLTWSSSSNAIVLTVAEGALLVWEDVVPDEMKGPNDLTGQTDDMEVLQNMFAGLFSCDRGLLLLTRVQTKTTATTPAASQPQVQRQGQWPRRERCPWNWTMTSCCAL
jgi:hypothetical protein